VQRIGLYHLHWPDPEVPIAESVGALAELRQAGKIAHIGVSNVDLAQVVEAQRVTSIASVQNRFSYPRTTGRDVLDHCTGNGIAFLAYSPLRGVSAEPVATVARRHGVSSAQVALAWLLAQSPLLVPIVGASRPETARSSTVRVSLTADDLALLG
jgi:aryl-alcohol dehydrogenase-like predicted oxidoreductase